MYDYALDQEEVFEEDVLTLAQQEVCRRKRTKIPFGAVVLSVIAILLLLLYYYIAVPIGYDIPLLRKTANMDHGWNLILINGDYHIPSDYDVELVTLANGQQVDRRIYPALQEMFDTMREEGVYPVVASGYRTEGKQRQLLDEKISEYEEIGYSWWKARREALQWVAKPGTSEHQLGIAVDINQEGTRSAAKQVYDWLDDNAHKYGFICRYPAEKTEITGVSDEPWHYRYVGVKAATQIYESGLTLEEYLMDIL